MIVVVAAVAVPIHHDQDSCSRFYFHSDSRFPCFLCSASYSYSYSYSSFLTRLAVDYQKTIFSGFKSLCIIFFLCIKLIAFNIDLIYLHASTSLNVFICLM